MTGIKVLLDSLAEPTIVLNKEKEVLVAKRFAIEKELNERCNSINSKAAKIDNKIAVIGKEMRDILWDYLIDEIFREYNWFEDENTGGINREDKWNCSIHLVVFDDFRWLRNIIHQYYGIMGKYCRLSSSSEISISYFVPDKGTWCELEILGCNNKVKETLEQFGITISDKKLHKGELTPNQKRKAEFVKEIRTLCSKEN